MGLSPSTWDAGVVEHLDELNQRETRMGVPTAEREHALAVGTRGAVTGTSGPQAVHAGLEALKAGGSAVDAALTTAMAQIVVSLGAPVSFAGILSMVHYEAETGDVT